MVALEHVVAPDGAAAGRGYSQVVTGRGRLVVVSGQIAQDERGELVGAGDPAAQARQVFENLRRCLAEAGAHFDDVVKLSFFVLDVADLAAVRAARDAVIDTSPAACQHGRTGGRSVRPGLPARGRGLGPGSRLSRAAHPGHIDGNHARRRARRDSVRSWCPSHRPGLRFKITRPGRLG